MLLNIEEVKERVANAGFIYEQVGNLLVLRNVAKEDIYKLRRAGFNDKGWRMVRKENDSDTTFKMEVKEETPCNRCDQYQKVKYFNWANHVMDWDLKDRCVHPEATKEREICDYETGRTVVVRGNSLFDACPFFNRRQQEN